MQGTCGQAPKQREDTRMKWKLLTSVIAVALALAAGSVQAGPAEDNHDHRVVRVSMLWAAS